MTKNNKISKTARKTARKKSRTVKKTRRIRVLNKNKGGGFKQEGGFKFKFKLPTFFSSEQEKLHLHITNLKQKLHEQAKPHGTHPKIQYILETYDECVDLIFNESKMNDPITILKNIDTHLDRSTKAVVQKAREVVKLLPVKIRYNIENIEEMSELSVDNTEFVNIFSLRSISRKNYVLEVWKGVVGKVDYDVKVNKNVKVNNSEANRDLYKLFYNFNKLLDIIVPFVVVEGNETTETYKVVDDPDIISNNVNEFFNDLFYEMSSEISDEIKTIYEKINKENEIAELKKHGFLQGYPYPRTKR